MRNSRNTSYSAKVNDVIGAVNNASSLYAQYLCRELEKIGMRTSYRHVMRPLMENKSLTQLELVKITGLKAPTISITLRNMEREGIVSREKNDSDRRETHVSITEKGRKMHAQALEAVARAEKLMLNGLTEKEMKAGAAVLKKMSDNLLAELGGSEG